MTGKPISVIGVAAHREQAVETGKRVDGIYEPQLHQNMVIPLSSSALLQMALDLRALLGDDYSRLETIDERGRRSRTPPRSRNRVIELIQFANEGAQRLAAFTGSPFSHVESHLLAEASQVLGVADRWAHHPAWPALRKTLATDEGPHTVMLLTLAGALVDDGNGVGVHLSPNSQGVTTADLWVQPNLAGRVDVEVKAPMPLRRPNREMTSAEAGRIVDRALHKSGRQRNNAASSILAIGGYHLQTTFDQMQASAARSLTAARRASGLLGVAVIDSTFQTEPDRLGQVSRFISTSRMQFVNNPQYRGPVDLRSEWE